MRFVNDGIGLVYNVEGPRTGLPVVFVHGFPFSQEMWKPQVEALKGSLYTVTYDMRGFGKSDVGDGQYTIEYFVDDLIALLDHLKIPRAVAVGLSMGGYVVLRAAERRPDRFRALVLSDTRSEADNNEGKIRRAIQALAVKKEGMKKFADSFLGSVFYPGTMEKLPDTVQLIRRIMESTSPVAAAGTLIALAARTDTTPALFNMNIPVLILVGQHDILTPPSASYAMKEKLPDAGLHIIPEAAHLSNLENPGEFNGHLLNFLKKIK